MTLLLDFFDENGWKEVPSFPHAHWQKEVSLGVTDLGYLEWVANECDAMGKTFRFADPRVEQEVAEQAPTPNPLDQVRFPREWWKEEVVALDTRRGYAMWARARATELANEVGEFYSDFDAPVPVSPAASEPVVETPAPRRGLRR